MRIGLRKPAAVDVQEAPRHSEVNQERATGFESNNQILAATIEGEHALRLQLGRHLGGVDGARQARVEDLDTLETATEERGLEPAADGLDLGQLGHGGQPSRLQTCDGTQGVGRC